MIIDCHCHAGKGDVLTAPWNTDAPIEPYLRRAGAAGITRTIVFPLFHGNYAQANAQLAKIVARYPTRWFASQCAHFLTSAAWRGWALIDGKRTNSSSSANDRRRWARA